MDKQLHIKGMVCSRCIAVLLRELAAKGVTVKNIELGKIVLELHTAEYRLVEVEKWIESLGFEVLVGKQDVMINRIKEIVQDTIDNFVQGKETKFKLSQVLADDLSLNYSSISELFSRTEGITLENYVIQRRLIKVKELLENTNKSFTEIAFLTGFSSVHHFSRQFKELTSYTPSQYRAQHNLPSLLKYPLKMRSSKGSHRELTTR